MKPLLFFFLQKINHCKNKMEWKLLLYGSNLWSENKKSLKKKKISIFFW